MPKVRNKGKVADKWVDVASRAGPYYEAGVKAPRRAWDEATIAAAPTWEQGVTAAIQAGRFKAGVSIAGMGKWQSKAATLGVSRYPEGVRAAKEDYARAVAPYLDEIEAITLPPRGPRGDPKNLDRVRAIADALAKKRQALLTSR